MFLYNMTIGRTARKPQMLKESNRKVKREHSVRVLEAMIEFGFYSYIDGKSLLDFEWVVVLESNNNIGVLLFRGMDYMLG